MGNDQVQLSMLVVSFMDAGKNVSNLRFPYLFIHMKAFQAAGKGILSGAPNENIFQNHLNIALLNVFYYLNGRYRHIFIP